MCHGQNFDDVLRFFWVGSSIHRNLENFHEFSIPIIFTLCWHSDSGMNGHTININNVLTMAHQLGFHGFHHKPTEKGEPTTKLRKQGAFSLPTM
jgi:hypothetical protein